MIRQVEPLLGVEEAAAILAVKRRTLMDWVRRREIPCIILRRGRDGRATLVRFEQLALRKWIEARRTPLVRVT